MHPLRGRQIHRPCERLEDVERRAHFAALLEPRVPGGADPGERRDLLAPEPRRPPATSVREAHVLRLDRGAALAQEVRELGPAPVSIRSHSAAPASVLFHGCCCYYQDKHLSCTWITTAENTTHESDQALFERAVARRLPGAVHGHPRCIDRERRAAVDPQRPPLLDHRLAVGRQRLHADVRRLPAARWTRRGSARPAARVHHRHGRLRGLLARLRARHEPRAAARRARALQGLAGALLSPATLSIITSTFREGAERNRGLGIWGAMGGLGASSGALLGGILTQSFSWPAIFAVNVPLGAIVIALGHARDPEGLRPRSSTPSVTSTSAAPYSSPPASRSRRSGSSAPTRSVGARPAC